MASSYYACTTKPPATALTLLVVVIITSRAADSVLAAGVGGDSAMKLRHRSWMAAHGRTYRDAAEEARRFAHFRSNAEYVDSFNAAHGGGSKSRPLLATNKFSDLSDEEFEAMMVGGLRKKPFKGAIPGFMYGDLPDVLPSQDWRVKGAVTAPDAQGQGSCGCCWAFSAAAAIEGIHAIRTGNLVRLSVQQLLDCSTGSKNRGCDKGDMEEAFLYVAGNGDAPRPGGLAPKNGVFWNGGIAAWSDYPYQQRQSNCSAAGKTVAATIRGFQYVPANNETALRLAVSQQPVSVALDGRSKTFRHYSSGIFGATAGETCQVSLNHAMTAVGYGTDEHGTKFWLMKNSWGTDWGDGGYVKIARDVESVTGLCGLAVQASYPVV